MGDTLTLACSRAAALPPPPGLLLAAALPGAAACYPAPGRGFHPDPCPGVPAWLARWRSERVAVVQGLARPFVPEASTQAGPPGPPGLGQGRSPRQPPSRPEAG